MRNLVIETLNGFSERSFRLIGVEKRLYTSLHYTVAWFDLGARCILSLWITFRIGHEAMILTHCFFTIVLQFSSNELNIHWLQSIIWQSNNFLKRLRQWIMPLDKTSLQLAWFCAIYCFVWLFSFVICLPVVRFVCSQPQSIKCLFQVWSKEIQTEWSHWSNGFSMEVMIGSLACFALWRTFSQPFVRYQGFLYISFAWHLWQNLSLNHHFVYRYCKLLSGLVSLKGKSISFYH